MLSKILIATDFSPASDCLVQCATELQAIGLKEVILAHVVYVANTPGLEETLEEEARPQMERQLAMLEEKGITARAELTMGLPAHKLDELATSHQVKAIMIGSRGGGLAKSALGSVSFKLLQLTSHPVFLSRINVEGKSDTCEVSVRPQAFDKILFATDFSQTAQRAGVFLKHILEQRPQTAVNLLHVCDAGDYARLSADGLKEQQELDRQRLEALQQELAAPRATFAIECVIGKPAEEIIARTANEGASLVVMGNHGKGFFREALLGSVANEVARRAEAPVLLVPSVH
ncbi:MAG: universal stress protein [Desulfurivibrio sp.]|nr:universal stress protein [Desulfurivibrio sp.]